MRDEKVRIYAAVRFAPRFAVHAVRMFQPQPGERAIVKAIYLDGTPGSYTASLVVFTCEPRQILPLRRGKQKSIPPQKKTLVKHWRRQKRAGKKCLFMRKMSFCSWPAKSQTGIGKALAYFNRGTGSPAQSFCIYCAGGRTGVQKSWKRRLLRPFRRQSVWRTTHRWEWAAR